MPLPGRSRQLDTGQRRELRHPRPGRVHAEVGLDLELVAVDAVAHAPADDAPAARFAQPFDELRVGEHDGAAFGGVERVRGAEARGVDAPFVEREGALDARREGGFESQRFGPREPRVRASVLEGWYWSYISRPISTSSGPIGSSGNTGITNGMRKIRCGAMRWIAPESTHECSVTSGSFCR